jgi:hypothetical protein
MKASVDSWARAVSWKGWASWGLRRSSQEVSEEGKARAVVCYNGQWRQKRRVPVYRTHVFPWDQFHMCTCLLLMLNNTFVPSTEATSTLRFSWYVVRYF